MLYRLLSVALLCFALSAHGQEATAEANAAPAEEAQPAPATEAPSAEAAPESGAAGAPAEAAPESAPDTDATADAPAEPAPAPAEPPVAAEPAPEMAPTPEVPPAVAEEPQSDIRMPERGMTMDEVEKEFGAPVTRKAAVGKPPITRWIYADYTVYFEYKSVIHSVLNRASDTP